MNVFIGELIGTMILILLGDGVVANVVLAKTKGNDSGWIVISAGWGFAVAIGVYVAGWASGAHINPAVTIGMVAAGNLAVSQVPVYLAGQFLGAFLGGVAGGWLSQNYGVEGVFLGNAAMAGAWLLVAVTMQQPRYLSSYLLRVGEVDENRAEKLVDQLNAVRGVAEAVVIPEDGVAYLKVDSRKLDKDALCSFSVP